MSARLAPLFRCAAAVCMAGLTLACHSHKVSDGQPTAPRYLSVLITSLVSYEDQYKTFLPLLRHWARRRMVELRMRTLRTWLTLSWRLELTSDMCITTSQPSRQAKRNSTRSRSRQNPVPGLAVGHTTLLMIQR